MKIAVHLSTPHPCGYFADRAATSAFIHPEQQITAEVYQQLLEIGFRRSGKLIYRPHCQQCQQCISLRVDAAQFLPSRSQKRILKRNQNVTYRLLDCGFKRAHYQLYKRYLSSRHHDGEMAQHDQFDYIDSMLVSKVNSQILEFSQNQDLLAVAIIDVLNDGLSAVYTFFDPEASSKLSLGTFAILSQIALVETLHKRWLYLGYWLNDCQKMSYKANFRPAQVFLDNQWQELSSQAQSSKRT